MKPASYKIVKSTAAFVLVRDVGPHDVFATVTNAAEDVVQELWVGGLLGDLRLFYFDTDGNLDEIVHDGPMFIAFRPVKTSEAKALGIVSD
jgi:hypothetical protein